jgi:hypothetical protein
MADIVNLRRARKAKARDQAAVTAAANRLMFGQSKAAKAAKAAENTRAESMLDQHKLGVPPEKSRR